MPIEALYSVYFRAKGGSTEKQAKERVYSFAFKNKRYYLDADDDIRRCYNLSPKEKEEKEEIPAFFPPTDEKNDGVILSFFDKQEIEPIRQTIPEMSVNMEEMRKQYYTASGKEISGVKAAKMLSDLGQPFWNQPAEPTRDKLFQILFNKPRVASEPEPAPAPAPAPAPLPIPESKPNLELETMLSKLDTIIEQNSQAIEKLTTELATAWEKVLKTIPAPKTKKIETSNEGDVEEHKGGRKPIPIAHASVRGLKINDILNEGEKVYFNISTDNKSQITLECVVREDLLVLPESDFEGKARYVASPSTALKSFKKLLVSKGLRKDLGSESEDGWKRGYVIRDDKQVKLISIPKKH